MTYIEVLCALMILSIIGTFLMQLFPQALLTNHRLIQRETLIRISSYVNDYLHNWTEFSPTSKVVPFDYYTDGLELELSGDKRVNQLQFMEPLLTTDNENVISDYYKVSMKFYETASFNRAVVNVRIWYDSNANDTYDSDENSLSYSTILVEKRTE